MDEFINSLKEESGGIVINAKTISEKNKEMLVLGTRDNYELNTKIRMLPGVRFIHPDSAEGKFFANDDTILRADDFFEEKSVSQIVLQTFDYSILSQYKSLSKDDERLVPQIIQPEESFQTLTADNYVKPQIEIKTQTLPPLYNLPQFNSARSWYSNMPTRDLNKGLEGIVNTGFNEDYRAQSRRVPGKPGYYMSLRYASSPYGN